MRSQRLQDRILPLHDAKDVLCIPGPDPGEPAVELCLARVGECLPVGVGLHQDLTDKISRVPYYQVLALSLDDGFHVGILPDPGVMVGPLQTIRMFTVKIVTRFGRNMVDEELRKPEN